MARQALISSPLSPLQTAAIRLFAGWLGLLPLLRGHLYPRGIAPAPAIRMVLATLLGTNLGILLQQMMFQTLPVGQGVTLLSTAPVMALLLARLEGDRLQFSGVLAAVLAVVGVACTSL